MEWEHQRVLVTGAGGFIGSHLVERLVSLGARTRAFVRYNSAGSWGWLDSLPVKGEVEVVQGDLRDSDGLRRAVEGVDVVFHLAALIGIPYSYHSPLAYVRTNVEGTVNLLQAALAAEVKLLVHTSTSEVYGPARYVPMDEDHPLQGQSPYSASKIAADKMVEAFYRSFDLPVTTLRPFNTFGPRQSARAVIPTIIAQALTQPEIRLGNLSTTRDFTFVADTVSGFVLAAERPDAVGQVVNLGTGREVSILDLAKEVLNQLGRDVPIVSDAQRMRPDTSEVERLCANNRKALDLLGWSPHYRLEEGLHHTLQWVEQNIGRYRPGSYAL